MNLDVDENLVNAAFARIAYLRLLIVYELFGLNHLNEGLIFD